LKHTIQPPPPPPSCGFSHLHFPPICKQDPLDVRINFILEHYERTGETIRLGEIPETMYGGALPIARKRKSKGRITSEANDVEESSEPKKKKAKKGLRT